ncbi:MAG: hypothetical protein ACLP7J_07055 [Streptosporangiaceae bacterium]
MHKSLDQISHMSASATSLSGLTSNVADLKSSVDALAGNAGAQVKAETSGLTAALSELQAAVHGVIKNPSAANIDKVKTAVQKVETEGRKLEAAVKSHCGS